MLFHLIDYLSQFFDIPAMGMMRSISFRSVAAIVLSLLITIVIGRTIIRALQRKQIGEQIRNLGLEGQMAKSGTPTMGGLIILTAILVPVLLLGNLSNIYIILMLVATIWLGLIGFMDDYIKVFRGNKKGLPGKLKVLGQVVLGVIVGTTMWAHAEIVIREKAPAYMAKSAEVVVAHDLGDGVKKVPLLAPEKSTMTTVPFFKNAQLDYRDLVPISGHVGDVLGWLLYILVATLVIVAVSNGANLTDGLDGLATGVSAPIVVVLGLLAYFSGNVIYAAYLDIPHIPGSGELMIFAAAFAGALIGFLW
ncbi:MAG: phospho-N-acetylmuramoyl-pentapeptide-transferase, partial [Mucinivorans sp.]